MSVKRNIDLHSPADCIENCTYGDLARAGIICISQANYSSDSPDGFLSKYRKPPSNCTQSENGRP